MNPQERFSPEGAHRLGKGCRLVGCRLVGWKVVAREPPTFQPINLPTFNFLTSRQSPSLTHHLEGLDDVTFSPVIELIKADTTFVASSDFLCIILHPLEGIQNTFVDHFAIAPHSYVAVAHCFARLHVATGNCAASNGEYGSNFHLTQWFFY